MNLRGALDWGELAPLRLRARQVADGLFSGAHPSRRRGAGVEFGGHRSYVPGDDLRWLDWRAYLRHGRLLVRELETETDRALRLVLDASLSMGFRGPRAPGAKLAFAAVLAAALARVAVAAGDPVAVDWLGGHELVRLPAQGGREAFERVLGALESARAGGDLLADPSAVTLGLAPVVRGARRGSTVLLFSDLVDLPESALDQLAVLATRGRTLIVTQVLDPQEASFDLDGPVRLVGLEGAAVAETDASFVRRAYLDRLEELRQSWEARLLAVDARLVRTRTDEAPIAAVRRVLAAVEGRRT